jgi:two-component sensor histidine kinase
MRFREERMTRLSARARRTNAADAPGKRLERAPTIHDSIPQFRWDARTGECWWSAGFRDLWQFDPDEPASLELERSRQHPDDRARLDQERARLLSEGGAYETSFRIVLPEGSTKWLLSRAYLKLDAQGQPEALSGVTIDITGLRSRQDAPDERGRVVRFSGITNDVTDRIIVEEELSAALERNKQLLTEKDLLLREMNHRIKNKLQLVTSLLNSQSRKSDDERLRYAITEAVVRVSSVGKLFDRLQRPTTSPAVHIPTYVGDLCAELQEALRATDDPQITPTVEDDTLEPDTAHALGLLIVELVTNALKHGERGAAITLSYSLRTDGKRQLIVTNFGRLPPDFSPGTTESLGMQVIGAMVSRLKGKIKFRQYPLGPMVECKITFRPPTPR